MLWTDGLQTTESRCGTNRRKETGVLSVSKVRKMFCNSTTWSQVRHKGDNEIRELKSCLQDKTQGKKFGGVLPVCFMCSWACLQSFIFSCCLSPNQNTLLPICKCRALIIIAQWRDTSPKLSSSDLLKHVVAPMVYATWQVLNAYLPKARQELQKSAVVTNVTGRIV